MPSMVEETHGTTRGLVLRRFLRHPPATVWRAITDPEQIRQWYLTTAKIDPRIGGAIELTLDPVGVRSTGRIVAWEPPHRYAYELTVPSIPGLGIGPEQSLVTWEVSPVAGGSWLELSHRPLSAAAVEVLKVGLPFFLLRLEAHLDGRTGPSWEDRVAEVARPSAPG